MIRTIAILVLLAATAAHAQLTTTVKRIRLEYATEPELAASTLEFGHVVVNEGNLADLRIGDGATPGGIRVGADWWTNNMLSAWGGLSRVDIEALLAFSLGYPKEQDAAALSAVAAVSDRVGVIESWGDHAEGSIYPPTATNFFIRPDGGTNTITFDADGTMIVSVDGAAALTVRTNGNLGVKNGGSGTYAIYATGDIFATARMRALDFRASDAGSYFLDPNGESMLASATFDGTLTVTQNVTRIIPPTSTNGLVSGTLWNDGGTPKIMP